MALVGGLRINAQRLSAEVTFAAAPGAFSFQVQKRGHGYRCELFARRRSGGGVDGNERGADRVEQCGGEICADCV